MAGGKGSCAIPGSWRMPRRKLRAVAWARLSALSVWRTSRLWIAGHNPLIALALQLISEFERRGVGIFRLERNGRVGAVAVESYRGDIHLHAAHVQSGFSGHAIQSVHHAFANSLCCLDVLGTSRQEQGACQNIHACHMMIIPTRLRSRPRAFLYGVFGHRPPHCDSLEPYDRSHS